ncbi:LamG-like jellyroll fold domain-containing protein [uncultured Winogradskyella sp.]|uniref:LamG-like jellyroll fold domain-containing protein n=1 Tax=uncultured Winogradskyella sp. TaxID=395353 RepID=UPI002617CCD0|nr:LamG-like jellyroll fold domain-containing protein [uncultured Winogradskyella sp.]
MKTKLLYLLVLVTTLSWSQGSTDYVKFYNFNNNTLENVVNPGTGDLVPDNTNYTFVSDITNMASSALNVATTSFDAGNFDTIFQTYTFSFWFKANVSGVGSGDFIISKLNNSNSGNFSQGGIVILHNNSGGIRVILREDGSSNSAFAESTINISDNNWRHIVVTVEPETISPSVTGYTAKVYVDGAFDASDTTNGLLTSNNPMITSANTSMFVNKPENCCVSNFQGAIDNLKVYDRVITQAEITALSNENNPPIVTIPDADFKSYLVGNTAINTNGDNEIQVTEANSFTGYIDPFSVSDWTGIEAFTNAVGLVADSNPATSINLFNNSSLEYFSYEEAFNLDNMVLPDPNNNSLTLVSITDATNLVAFNPADYPNLEFYGCAECITTNVDFSNNLALTFVNLSGTNIEYLDLTLQTNLTSVYVRDCPSLLAMDISNGNNSNIAQFNYNSQLTPNLSCVAVDNVAYANNTFSQRDAANVFTTACTLLSVEEFDAVNDLIIYPNPTSSFINIETKFEFKNAVIYSILGKEVLQISSKSINISELNNGVYLIKVKDENGNISIKRFVKQ